MYDEMKMDSDSISDERSIINRMRSIVVAVLFSLLTACSEAPSLTLTVGSNQWPGYETLHLAKKLNLYDDYAIKLVELTSATDVINAFKYGQLDVAALTLDEAILLAQDVPDIVVFLVMDISHGADKLIAKPDIKTLQDLVNKRIGVEQTALGAFFFSQVLKKAELSSTQVIVVPTTVDQHLRMMEMDNLDAVVTFEPTASKLLSQGNLSLFDSSEIPDKIVDVLVTTESQINTKNDSLKQLVSAQWEALNYLSSNPIEAAMIMAPRLHVSAEQLLSSYDDLLLPNQQRNQTLLGGELLKTAIQLNTLMVEEGIHNGQVDVRNLISDRFVQ